MLNLLKLLKAHKYKKYYAHISGENKETLLEHTELVKRYFLKFIKIHKLDKVIDLLIRDFIKIYHFKDIELAKKLVKSIFLTTPDFHDIGKLNPNFQYSKMDNKEFNNIIASFGSNHSKIGAFLFIQNFLKETNDEKYSSKSKILNLSILFAFSFSILQHHSSKIDYNNEYLFDNKFINDILKFIEGDIFLAFPKNMQENIGKMFNQKILLEAKKLFSQDSFALFALLKLNYSLLTAADYFATTHYMNDWKEIPNDFGVFDSDLKKKIIKNIETSTSYNKKTYGGLENYQFDFPQEADRQNLNKLRQNLAVETILGIRKNIDKNLFYVEAPTGGGKTNLSMLAIAEFLKNDINTNQNTITKVFYVFPFTTLITQTFKSLKETLGLGENKIVQIHSKAGFSQKNNDDKYGKDKLNIIDYQFVNYPIALLSHIKFFDILKSNKKSVNYLMHRLANSIVIIDELQTYSPKEWDKVIYFINKYAKYFNIKFLLMSATLPKIDKLLSKEAENYDFEKDEFVILNKNKGKYFTNPNFKNRVEFNFSMLKNTDFDKTNKELFLNNLWNKIEKESKAYLKKSKNKRVHTIIEFIFKKTANEFMILANSQNIFFDEIFLLSGTTLEPRRKEIINKLKSDDYKSKSILLITTQIVEAGVDIDMDLGFKDSSLVDSDEQLSGRINRNMDKSQCKLFIFDYDDAKVIYGKDYRFKKIKNELKNEYSRILETKNFDIIYNSVMDYKNNHNRQKDYADNLPAYLNNIKNLKFDSVDKNFQLIENSTQIVTIFVPIEIMIQIPYSIEKNFNRNELGFLKKMEKYENEEIVDGEKVWELYCEIIGNKYQDFTNQKIDKIIMQGLISKFSFSIGLYSKGMINIINSGNCEEKYGFYKLNNVEEVYDYENGIKDMKFEDIYFW